MAGIGQLIDRRHDREICVSNFRLPHFASCCALILLCRHVHLRVVAKLHSPLLSLSLSDLSIGAPKLVITLFRNMYFKSGTDLVQSFQIFLYRSETETEMNAALKVKMFMATLRMDKKLRTVAYESSKKNACDGKSNLKFKILQIFLFIFNQICL